MGWFICQGFVWQMLHHACRFLKHQLAQTAGTLSFPWDYQWFIFKRRPFDWWECQEAVQCRNEWNSSVERRWRSLHHRRVNLIALLCLDKPWNFWCLKLDQPSSLSNFLYSTNHRTFWTLDLWTVFRTSEMEASSPGNEMEACKQVMVMQ